MVKSGIITGESAKSEVETDSSNKRNKYRKKIRVSNAGLRPDIVHSGYEIGVRKKHMVKLTPIKII